ncbi:MAG: hypothetical protein UY96_C0013G0002 [Parcubacteria group bacterium GW2011_GWB1_56_8]|nr:MAG: hypothetical protein UY96_C0013G0002 [Parcubacteria group bacterium GW2011_GWB1_56_8]
MPQSNLLTPQDIIDLESLRLEAEKRHLSCVQNIAGLPCILKIPQAAKLSTLCVRLLDEPTKSGDEPDCLLALAIANILGFNRQPTLRLHPTIKLQQDEFIHDGTQTYWTLDWTRDSDPCAAS